MVETVLNEKQWVEDVLASSDMGKNPSVTFARIACYYHTLGYKKHEIGKMLEEFLIRCDPNANLVRWQQLVDKSVKYARKRTLVQVDPVVITNKEVASIKEVKGVLAQRLMFTLLCLAKYGNAVNAKNNSWVNRDIRDILALANVKVTTRRQSLLFNDLWQAGYIGYSNIVDNINVNVKIIDDCNGNIAMLIDDFRNLGNQYMKHIGDGYMVCESCGLVVKKNAPNQKYCKECAASINIQKTIENRSKDIA